MAVSEEVKDFCAALVRPGEPQSIFVKDMAYHAEPFVSDGFLCAINNTFLIRDPKLSIPSLYKMRANYAERETGFEGLFALFNRVKTLTGETPLVIDAEQLRVSADRIVRDYFAHIGESMPTDILSWPTGTRVEWASRESWHLRAINSVGFEKTVEQVDHFRLPERVTQSIKRNLPYYEQLKHVVLDYSRSR